MMHVPAHKSGTAGQVIQSEPAPHKGYEKVMWMNIYRSGWFHRKGKPGTVDRHAGDFYESREAAVRDIEPRSHYIATVPFMYVDPEDVRENSMESVPEAISVSRKKFAEQQAAVAA